MISKLTVSGLAAAALLYLVFQKSRWNNSSKRYISMRI